ncbi:hypothetical protein TRICI_001719 [Trichomonascus ciferrii]|uniref:Telomere-associated protein Rif1 N-terminal domain-containing protein n=1 Tax=Trichomonascus ciferrii TaxID=44093 RepID=A0A642VC97_9ASCO|nr:hypothetical protein TRICI_001719 [Trichomonascus ciferrii]
MAYAAVLSRSGHAAGSEDSERPEGGRREKKVDFPENLTPENEAPSSPPDPDSQPSRSILKKDGIEANDAEKERSANEEPVVVTPRTLHDIYSSAVDLKSILDCNELLRVAMVELEKNDMEKHYIYAALHSSLRAKAATISPVTLSSSANLLTRHAKRDLINAEPTTNPAHTNAVISILKVVDYLFFTPSTASAIDSSLSNWFLNRGLEALENPETSRSVVGIYLHIFNYQKLPQGITSDMANRLFAIILKGPKFMSPTIVCEYIAIYRLLLRSAPYMMTGKINEWLPFCFRHLVDPNSSVQKQTLYVLQDSSLRFLGRADMATAARGTLSEQVSLPSMDERFLLVDVLSKQISTSLATNTGANTALSIWKTVLLSILQFGSSDRIYNWAHFENFLRLSKLGFNSSNEETRIATIQSWKVPIFVYTETPFYQYPVDDLDTSISVVLHPFKIFETLSISSRVQNSLLSSYYALLFMSLKGVPNLNLNSNQLAIVWEKLVGPVIQMMFRGNDSAVDAAVSILSHLFSVGSHSSPVKGSSNANKSPPRVLNDSPVHLDEIPSFPPRWVRSNVMKVLMLLNSLFKSRRNHKFVETWAAFLGSIRHIAQRDIRVSSETMDSIAGVGNFVRDCLKQVQVDYEMVGRLIEETVDAFGINLLSTGTIDVCPETSIVFSKKGGATAKPGAISMDPITYFFRIATKYGSGPKSQDLLFTILNLFSEKLPQGETKDLRIATFLNSTFESLTSDDYRAWKCVAYGIRQNMPQSVHFNDYQSIPQWLLL